MAWGVCAWGHAWLRVCITGGHAWMGACMDRGMHGWGHAWMVACVAGGVAAPSPAKQGFNMLVMAAATAALCPEYLDSWSLW